jgi:hypothetical protein
MASRTERCTTSWGSAKLDARSSEEVEHCVSGWKELGMVVVGHAVKDMVRWSRSSRWPRGEGHVY